MNSVYVQQPIENYHLELIRQVQNGDINIFFKHVHSTANSSSSNHLKGQWALTEPFDFTFLNVHISHPSEELPRIKCLNSHCDHVRKIFVSHMTYQKCQITLQDK